MTTRRCWPRCGIWCGRVTSPTIRWRAAGVCCRRRHAPHRAAWAATAGAASPARTAGRCGPLVARRASFTDPRPDQTVACARSRSQLAERYGVLTREAALGEGAEGGFAGVYPMLKVLEERGQMRRGYFVAGLGAVTVRVAGRGRPAALDPRRYRG